LSPHNKLILYKLLICSILTYAAPVWSNTSNTNYRHLQTLQSKCLRVIGNYPRRTPIPLIHSTLNIEPLHDFIHPLPEKFFHQCSIHQNPSAARSETIPWPTSSNSTKNIFTNALNIFYCNSTQWLQCFCLLFNSFHCRNFAVSNYLRAIDKTLL
jgi:hypothetical protein